VEEVEEMEEVEVVVAGDQARDHQGTVR